MIRIAMKNSAVIILGVISICKYGMAKEHIIFGCSSQSKQRKRK